jgi:hypothetical protein
MTLGKASGQRTNIIVGFDMLRLTYCHDDVDESMFSPSPPYARPGITYHWPFFLMALGDRFSS